MASSVPDQNRSKRSVHKDLRGPSPKHIRNRGFGNIVRRAWWIGYYTAEFLIMLVGYVPIHFVRMLLYIWVFGVTIGTGTSIHSRCRFYNPKGVQIGSNTIINNDVLLDGRNGIKIGNNVSVSEGVAILTLEHDLDSPEFATMGGPVRIEDFVFVGTRALILPGVTLGKGSAVGAGSVVTRSVEPYAIVTGSPARLVRYRSSNLQYILKYRKFLG